MAKNILFVDDDRAFLTSIKRSLESLSEQWNICFCTNADEAEEMIQTTNFDTVVIDAFMPSRDGFSLLKSLHDSESTKAIPIIIITGGGDDVLKHKALRLGATDLLNKPIHIDDLIARLNNTIKLKTYEDKLRHQNEILEEIVQQRTAELENTRLNIILRLGKAAEYRDEETGNHVLRVGCYSRAISEELKQSRDFGENIFLTSPLHDIGKIGIPDKILLKPGPLTDEERSIMERHCEIGADILINQPKGLEPFLRWHTSDKKAKVTETPLFKMAYDIAMCHHERWDGSGYPKGLKGLEIPLVARIVALADIYDALRSNRPYKQGYPEEKTLDIMRKQASSYFDPVIFHAFENITSTFDSICHMFVDSPQTDEELITTG